MAVLFFMSSSVSVWAALDVPVSTGHSHLSCPSHTEHKTQAVQDNCEHCCQGQECLKVCQSLAGSSGSAVLPVLSNQHDYNQAETYAGIIVPIPDGRQADTLYRPPIYIA